MCTALNNFVKEHTDIDSNFVRDLQLVVSFKRASNSAVNSLQMRVETVKNIYA